LDDGKLLERVLPYLVKAGLVTTAVSNEKKAWLLAVVHLFRERLSRLDQAPEAMRYFFTDELVYDEKGVQKHFADKQNLARLRELGAALAGLEPFTAASVEQKVRNLAEAQGLSASKVIHPVRLAVSGCLAGPGLFEMLEVLGKETVLARLDRAVAKFA
jgi:glutamyl/glutaminyl-tRNA synthetase